MTRLLLISFLFLLVLEKVFSQSDISIESIVVSDYESEIPHAIGEDTQMVNEVNALIMDHFMIDHFEQLEVENFRWYDLYFEYEIKSNILCIDYEGEYTGGPYPNYIDYQLLIDLRKRRELEMKEIPFSAFFTLDGYYRFLDKYWMDGVKSSFQEARECAEGSEPYCSLYDVSYGLTATELSIQLTDDCYPHVLLGCSPGYSATIPMEEVIVFLNDFGKKALVEDRYAANSLLNQYLYYEVNKKGIPDNAFLIGKIDSKYPFKMALEIDSLRNSVRGYYYYKKNKVKIDLEGSIEGNKMLITETLDQETTGYFEFSLEDVYQSPGVYIGEDKYLLGSWLKPDRSRGMAIEFEKVVFSKK